jgi:hypothetical protein
MTCPTQTVANVARRDRVYAKLECTLAGVIVEGRRALSVMFSTAGGRRLKADGTSGLQGEFGIAAISAARPTSRHSLAVHSNLLGGPTLCCDFGVQSASEFNGFQPNSLRNGTGNFQRRIRENFSRNREFPPTDPRKQPNPNQVLACRSACLISTVKIDFSADDPGPSLLHCHHLDHQDGGFMCLMTYL